MLNKNNKFCSNIIDIDIFLSDIKDGLKKKNIVIDLGIHFRIRNNYIDE